MAIAKLSIDIEARLSNLQAGLDKAGKRREPSPAPLRVGPQQETVPLVGDRHDDGRIRAGKVLRAVRGARPHPAALHDVGCRAATGAVPVGGVTKPL